MSGRRGKYRSGAGYGSGVWPVLLSLLVVMVPTACVLWFLNEAVRNERLAARQKLLEAYRGQLPLLRDRLDEYWRQQGKLLASTTEKDSAAEAFAACVEAGLADGVAVYDASGGTSYPVAPIVSAEQPDKDEAWAETERLEYVDNDPAAAASAYAKIAAAANDDRTAKHRAASSAFWKWARRCRAGD